MIETVVVYSPVDICYPLPLGLERLLELQKKSSDSNPNHVFKTPS